MLAAFITGLSGLTLTANERSFLATSKPAGVILFARNCDTPEQVRRLVTEAKSAIADDRVLVLIDQEGGRVQRLRPPHWRALPPGRIFAEMFTRDPNKALMAARDVSRLTANDLRALGISCNCAPVLDVPVTGSHDIIGDRAYGSQAAQVAALGWAVAAGLMDGGVLPVIKHIPGHGRARADSHFELPIVDTSLDVLTATDFEAFRLLNEMPAAMTAHVVYSAIDPHYPASTSQRVTSTIIRDYIGFDGLLMSDDLSMQALQGTIAERADAVLKSGSDLALHCNGNAAEMDQVAGAVPMLDGRALARFERAYQTTRQHQPFSLANAEAQLADVMRLVA
jgi:beta-N-acetylhexosaminidase